jgi:cell wall assembly regulator SMI1
MSLKSVMAKVAGIEQEKIELASQKIELGLAEDVKKAYQVAINTRKSHTQKYQELKRIVEQTKKDLDMYKRMNEEALATFNKYEMAAKELGLSLPADVLNNKKNIEEGLKTQFTVYDKNIKGIKL